VCDAWGVAVVVASEVLDGWLVTHPPLASADWLPNDLLIVGNFAGAGLQRGACSDRDVPTWTRQIVPPGDSLTAYLMNNATVRIGYRRAGWFRWFERRELMLFGYA